MKNHVQPGNTNTVPSPDDVQGGEIVTMGELVGVAAGDAATGEDPDLLLAGVFDLPKVGTDAIVIGAPVYVDANGLVTVEEDGGDTPTPNPHAFLGHAVTAAPNPSGSVNVRLKPKFDSKSRKMASCDFSSPYFSMSYCTERSRSGGFLL